MNDTELKKQYSQELWGKLLIEMGMEPYDTESSARQVADYTSQRIASLEIERNEWKAKFLQHNIDLGHELQDPNGTVWDECKRLQKENEVLTIKLARIQKMIEHPDPYWAIEEIESQPKTGDTKQKEDEWLASLPLFIDYIALKGLDKPSNFMNKTPETWEAWNAVGRLPNGTFRRDTSLREHTLTMLDHSKKMEIERNEWKDKFRQQKIDIGHELQAPNGTVWDECERLKKKNEVLITKLARIQKLIEHPDHYWAFEEIERETKNF